ncbi:MAG: YcaQ family DNA glycosylase [Anaerolineae bacterium]|nr:YcaQ family DNA glycosylase [Anaerolineae bacterium]
MAKVRKAYPLSAVRSMALHAQGLLAAPAPPTLDGLEAMIDRLVCVQIDTLQMVHRSQYLLLWSRFGNYDPRDLDRLIFGTVNVDGKKSKKNDRRAFEYWLKEACIIPLKDYRYSLALKRWRQEENRHWWQTWLEDKVNHDILDHVRTRIDSEGGLRTSDFEYEGPRRSSWWDWKPAKLALEHLYNTGEMMIANRINFQRVYDMTERVLPSWVDATEPTMDERNRYYLERSVRAHGVCFPLQAADYTHTKRSAVKTLVAQMIEEGLFVTVPATLADGKTHHMIVHRDDLKTLNKAADKALPPTRTTFLTPFDSLFWGLQRDKQLFDFNQTLECYKPEPQRIWGYFCLPILHKDRLVGRFDPKLERNTGTLRIKALHLEPGIAPDEALVADVAGSMRDFLAFHKAQTLVIEKSNPEEFGAALMKAM